MGTDLGDGAAQGADQGAVAGLALEAVRGATRQLEQVVERNSADGQIAVGRVHHDSSMASVTLGGKEVV